MKKCLFSILLFTCFITGCTNNIEINDQNNINWEQQYNIKKTLKNIIKEQRSYDNSSELFVNIVLLWRSINKNWNTEYYLIADWQWFYIDERWNLNNDWWFSNLPTTIELDKNGNLIRYETAKDWSEYESSIKEMFSDKAFDKRINADFDLSDYVPPLKQAEEYFGIKIIPEWEMNFKCSFCDKLRYYEPNNTDLNTNDLIYNYVLNNNWNNTIYFSSDWYFEAKGSRDEWRGTRTFGQDENTIIVSNNNLDHIYDRYIITNQTDNSLSTILEIIQRR